MNCAILVAAGRGTRMGGNGDKLWLELAGRPVIAHTWQKFNDAACISRIILAVREGMQPAFENLAAQARFQKPFAVVPGGTERQDSVWNGLEALPPGAHLVAIQDAARPCTSEELIVATLKAAEETGAAVAAQPVTDTLKESADGQFIQRTLDRSRLWAVQTPQAFRVDVIRRAIAAARARNLIFSDDTAGCELIGQPVRLVSNLAPNPKVTTPGDVSFIEMLLRQSGPKSPEPLHR